MKVLFFDTVHPILQRKLSQKGLQCLDLTNATLQKIQPYLPQANGIVLRSKYILDKKILDQCSNLKFIARSGSGLENINLEETTKRKIQVFNSPEGNRDAVAEHTLGLILSLINNFVQGNEQIRNNIWLREQNRGLQLSNMCVGIIGYGNMGMAVAQRLYSFKCKVLAYDKYKKKYSDQYVQESSLKEIYQNCNIISLHIPLTDETRYIVNKNFFENMKHPFYLINTARGKNVNTQDLLHAISKNKVLGAGLDVLEFEHSSFTQIETNPVLQQLFKNKKVLLTPHVAGWTTESYYKLSDVLAKKIINHFQF